MLSESEDEDASKKMSGGKVVDNHAKLVELRDRIEKQIKDDRLLITNGQTVIINPAYSFYKDVLSLLVSIDNKKQHDEYSRETAIMQQKMRQTGEVDVNVDPDFERFCKKYNIELNHKEDKRLSYDKS
jgi:hypothetical protein